jgi:hypothetical protein
MTARRSPQDPAGAAPEPSGGQGKAERSTPRRGSVRRCSDALGHAWVLDAGERRRRVGAEPWVCMRCSAAIWVDFSADKWTAR